VDKRRVYAAPARVKLNDWALSGDWTVKKDAVVLNKASGRIAYRFHAATFIWSWTDGARSFRAIFACSSMDSRRALLTESTSTTKATARLPSSGCIN